MEDLRNFKLKVTDHVFDLFAEFIYRESGIELKRNKKHLLISRLLRRIMHLNLSGLEEYYDIVNTDKEELIEMLNLITTSTTKFFREYHHFQYLGNTVVPDLLKTKKDREIRIWSAGCSTGEEPYSIAVTFHEAFASLNGNPADRRFKILATDIDTGSLEKCKKGIYEYDQIPDNIPMEVIKRYFLSGTGINTGEIKAGPLLRDTITFRYLNLKNHDLPFHFKFDIIFCRNVMIYFDETMQRHALRIFHRYLSDRGYLFLGHSEMIRKEKKFKPVHITVFKKM